MNSAGWHTAFYIGIICWESMVMLLCWVGSWQMLRHRAGSGATFEQSKRVAIAALTLALLMWLVAFLSVGGE
jgi:predicted small integral membrane protein